MSLEQNLRLKAHYEGLAGGSLKSGNSVKDELVVSDAERHLADLLLKNPGLNEPEKPKESKSKGKK